MDITRFPEINMLLYCSEIAAVATTANSSGMSQVCEFSHRDSTLFGTMAKKEKNIAIISISKA